ncbi:hypothetical protein E0Z10_g10563 [Xylaria hypoxylon]|uniref:BZIP domain-containing protein n=1 Tax=Xylaria hypoxylon TaxID=37992 RepID=A0A4Z0YG05_9PEZI|nr:hypothetical protein E0Z10_g10563 [Xylaria hypoxylon]
MASSAVLLNSSSNIATRPHPTRLAISPPAACSPASDFSPTSNVSTPSSATPQVAIRPVSTGVQIATMAIGPPKTSITSKEWVIPPRPKPGRKPATDTPPTKRKAQNRAAQRAFRERRAARVGELEEELEEQREEYEHAQQQLQHQIDGLNTEVESLRSQCGDLQDTIEKERAERVVLTNELESLRRRWREEASSISSRNGSFMSHHGRVPSLSSQHQASRGSLANNAPGHRNSTAAFSIPQMISPPESSASSSHPQTLQDVTGCGNCSSTGSCPCVDNALASASVECGKCSIGTRCECLEAALNSSAAVAETELKRKPSSISEIAPEEKRQRAESYPNEIDFTAMFSSKKKKVFSIAPAPIEPLPSAQPSLQPRESCGFCTESSYCMCAETAAAQTLPPMGQQVQTPPPSEDDVGPPPMEVTSTGAIKLPSLRSLNRNSFQPTRKANGCGANGPGTCSQCLRDPKSGLFCRSLAASFARESGNTSGGCCGGSGGSGCCKSANPPAQTSNPASGVSLSCADAYQTLSSHPCFEQATDEIETWLPKLRAIPKPTSTFGRTALDVETASIMGVLKEFDVRFGRNK